jgi:hypothetical protein
MLSYGDRARFFESSREEQRGPKEPRDLACLGRCGCEFRNAEHKHPVVLRTGKGAAQNANVMLNSE